MLNIEVDEEQAKALFLEEVRAKLKDYNADLVFWDRKELMRRTCMSWGTIQKIFFYESGFPKYKVGGKWMFPADETKEFLLDWLKEQPRG